MGGVWAPFLCFLSFFIVTSPLLSPLWCFRFISLCLSQHLLSPFPPVFLSLRLFPLCSPETTVLDTQTPALAPGQRLGWEECHCGCSKFCPLTCDGEEEGGQVAGPLHHAQGTGLLAGCRAAGSSWQVPNLEAKR